MPAYTFTVMNPPDSLDPRAARLQAQRRARSGSPHFLQQTVERGLLERLEPVRLAPKRIIVSPGSLSGELLALRQRFPEAELLACDDQSNGLARLRERLSPARGFFARLRRMREEPVARFVAADPLRLPFASASADLVLSALALHSCPSPEAQIAEWRRVLRPGGLLAFACLGVDTLVELRRLGARMPAFPDMHDLGDMLVGQGLAEPVVDTARLTVTWRDPQTLLAEVRQWGGNARPDRFRGLLTPRHRREWLAAIESLRGADGLISLTVELVHGHAWCPAERRLPEGFAPIRVMRPGER